MVNRRHFLKLLPAAAIGAALTDYLSALVPSGCSLSEINTITMKEIMPGIADEFFRKDPLISYMKLNRAYESCVVGEEKPNLILHEGEIILRRS